MAQTDRPPPADDRARSVECLTLAIAYEAGYEPLEGQQAIAEVVLNRVRSPSFPKSVCNVVFAGSTRRTGCQFTFTCDGSLGRRLPRRILDAARSTAEQALSGGLPSLVAGATNYHADYIYPYWAPGLVRVGKIGTHMFYRRTGAALPDNASLPAGASGPRAMIPSSTPPPAFAPWGLTMAANPVQREEARP